MTARKYRVVATTRFGGRRLVYHLGSGRYSWRRGKTGKVWLTAQQAEAAKKWVTRRLGKNVRMVGPGQYPFLELVSGAAWPTDKALLRALNRVGQRRRRVVRIISGKRTLAQQQALYDKYQRYLNGGPYANLAAYPNANAPHIRGVAADCGVVSARGRYTSLGLDRKARKHAEAAGLRAWVNGEPWHWQTVHTY